MYSESGINKITFTNNSSNAYVTTIAVTYFSTTSSLVASGSETSWSYGDDDTKTWDFTGVTFSDFAGKTEWTAGDATPSYYYVNQQLTSREFNITGLEGLRFTKGSSNYLQFNNTVTSTNPVRLRISGGNSFTIPSVGKGATITIRHSNAWYGSSASTDTKVPVVTNATAPTTDDVAASYDGYNTAYYKSAFTVSSTGDVTFAAPSGEADWLTIAEIVVTKPTTIASTLTTTTAQDADANWDFTNTTNFDEALTAVKAVSDEWGLGGKNTFYQWKASTSASTEFNFTLLKGLQFKGVQGTGNMLVRLSVNKDYVQLNSNISMTLPGVQRKYVMLKHNGGNTPASFTPSNATLIASNATCYLYEVTTLGSDVSFSLGRGGNDYINLTSIQVTNTLPTGELKLNYKGLDLNTELWNGSKFDGTNTNGSDMTRTVKGFTFAFGGSDGVKAQQDDYLTVKASLSGTITITAPAGAIITSVTLADAAGSADNYTYTASAGTVTATGDGSSATTFTIADGTLANSLTLTHNSSSATELHVTDITIAYQGIAGDKATPTLGFGDDATVDGSDATKATFTVDGGSKIYLQATHSNNKSKHYLDKASASWKLANSTVTSSDNDVLKVDKDANGAVTVTANNAETEDVTATLTVQYVPTADDADTLFNQSNTLTFTVTVKPNTSGNRTIKVQKLLYSYRSGGQTVDKNIDRAVRGIKISFAETENDKGVFANAANTSTLADKADDNINITSKGSMTLSFDNSNLAEAQQGHARFTKVGFKLSSTITSSTDLSTILTTSASGWTAAYAASDSIVFSGPAASSLTFTGGSTGITFTQFDFDWAGDTSWPGGDLTDYKPTPTLTAKSKKIWLTPGDVTGSNGISKVNINCSVGSFYFATAYSSSNTSVATVSSSNAVTAVADGSATITGSVTMTSFGDNNDYFTVPTSAITDSYDVVVGSPNYTSGQVWNFAAPGSNGVPSGEGGKIGYSGETVQTFGTGTTWSALNDSSEYELSTASASASTFATLVTDSANTVLRTDGLQFSQTAADQIKVKPGEYLRANDRVHIKIENVSKGAVILVRAITGTTGVGAGFSKDDQTNLTVLDADHETSVRETDFILKASAQGDVVLKPTADMKIYRIKVYPATATLYYVNMRANRPSTSPIEYSTVTDTEAANGANNYYYGYSGFKGLNNNSQKGIVPHMDAETTATMCDNILWTLPRNSDTTLGDYLKGSTPDVTGTWTTYATNDIVSLSGTTVTAGSKGGVSTIVAKFTPSDETKATVTYGFFTVYVNDLTAFRVTLGEDLGHYNQGGANKVNRVVWTPSNVEDSTSTDVTMLCTLGGWDGATDDARGNGSTMVDGWNLGKKDAYLTTQDGFDYAVNARQKSSDEEGRRYITSKSSMSATNLTGGTITLDNTDGTLSDDQTSAGLVEGTPYQMPCRGGFLKFQPQKNGALTVYIHQNGVVGNDENDDYTPGIFHMRSYYVADETGHLFSQSATDDYKLTVTSTATLNKWGNAEDGLLANYKTTAGENSDEYTAHKAEFEWFKSQGEGLELKPVSTSGTPLTLTSTLGGITPGDGWKAYYQPVLEYNGAQVTIDESQCIYTFDVKAGKTYFMFTSGTSMGFCGFTFVPSTTSETAVQPAAETSTSWSNPVSTSQAAPLSSSFSKSLTANQWNAVCLPFTMNEKQTKEAFGADCSIIDFDDCSSNTLYFKKHQYQMIIAGRPYLVKTSNSTMGIPSTPVYFDSSLTEGGKVAAKSGYNMSLIGNFAYISKSLPQYCYVLNSNSVIVQNTSTKASLKGYRAYINSSDGTQLAKMQLKVSMGDGIDEVVTGIEDVVADLEDPETSGNVYSLSGVKVSGNGLRNLPAGIYIMNGKKYVVK